MSAAIRVMVENDADEVSVGPAPQAPQARRRQATCSRLGQVVLEAEETNEKAIGLYTRLGFARAKYLYRYYLSGVSAYRLKLWLK